MTARRKGSYRSAAWFGQQDKDGFIHRSWMRNQGFPPDVFDGRPVIGICNTWSELTPCNAHLRTLAEHVKRGVWEAGGLPLEFPVTSLGESNLRPTAMLFRNLVSMDVEESIRGNPIDGVVLLCGCDKTTPALVMGAASCDLPALVVSGGPMLNGKFCGQDIGSGTDVWRFSEDVRAGRMSVEQFLDAEGGMSRSAGHCMVMGTASTMGSMVEALGLGLPFNATLPAVDSRRYALAHIAGRRIVDLVEEDVRLSRILTREAFENAIRVNGAIGGSTNAVIHLLAIAGRVGVPLSLDDWDTLGRGVPTIVDLKPSGRFLMEDFHYAGGLPAVIRALGDQGLLNRDALTVNGRTIWENCREASNWNTEVIRPVDAAADRARRDCRAARQPRARRRRAEALGGFAVAADASRPRDRVRHHRALQEAHRGSGARRRRDVRAGVEELRAGRLSGDGGGRQHGPAAGGAAHGRHRHGAHFRRADERHRVRHGGAARLSRGRGRRSAGARARRRHRSNWMSRPAACTSMSAMTSCARRRADGTRPRRPRQATRAVRAARGAGGQGRRPRLPQRLPRRPGPSRITLNRVRNSA